MAGGFGSAYNGEAPKKVKGGFGSAYHSVEPPAPVVPTAATEHHGTLFGNLLGDVGHAITGTGIAAYHGGAHIAGDEWAGHYTFPSTREAVAATGRSVTHQEALTWGPVADSVSHSMKAVYHLAQGDVAGWHRENGRAEAATLKAHEIWHAHPLAPILDMTAARAVVLARVEALSTLPEGATGAQVRHAALTGHYQGPLRTITVQGAEGAAPVIARVLPRNAARAARMERNDALLKALPPTTPRIGEHARAARVGRRQVDQGLLAAMVDPAFEAYMRARGRLTGWEGAALQMLTKLPSPADRAAHVANLRGREANPNLPEAMRKAARQEADILSDPRVQKAFTDPRVLKAHELGKAVGAIREEHLAGQGHDLAALAEAPYRHMRVIRGASFRTPYLPAGPELKVGETVKVAGQKAEGKVVDVKGGQVTVYYARFGRAMKLPASKLEVKAGQEGLHGGPAVADLKAELAKEGLPQPYYLPDVMDVPGPIRGAIRKARGLTPPPTDVHTWHGTIFQAGLLALRPDVLGPAYIRAVTTTAARELHEFARDHLAVAVPEDHNLPSGHQWLREKRGQKIPYLVTHMEEHAENTGRAFPEIRDTGPFTASADEALHHPDLIARDAQGNRLAVSDAAVRELDVKTREVAGIVRRIYDESTQVWRALVLNLRIPWLEANVVGNHIMASLRFAGPAGLAAYLHSLAEVKGVAAVRRLLNMPETRLALTDAQMRALAPQQTRAGTFLGANRPEGTIGRMTSRLPRPAKVVAQAPAKVIGFLPNVDKATEGFLRRFGMNTVLRTEAKAFARGMPKQTRDLQKAWDTVSTDPTTLAHASREVNDALGDFLSLSYAERDKVRAMVPFYAWYREITRILLKLPLNAPGRTALVAKLGQAAQSQPGFPTYLQGDPTLGLDAQGRQELLALRNMNPYTTPLDLGRAISALWSGKRTGAQQAQGSFNPFLVTIAGTIARAASGDYRAKGVMQAFYDDFLLQLPEAKIATNKPSPLYPGRTRKDLAEQFLGKPTRAIDPAVAAEYAAEGR